MNVSVELEYQEQPLSHIGLLWTIFMISGTMGNMLLLSVLHYERYGGDPQKRSVRNRLGFDITFSILLMVNLGIVAFVRVEMGYKEDDINLTLSKAHRGFNFAAVTFMNLHSLITYSQVVVFKHVKAINDELLGKCLRRTAYGSSLWLSFMLPLNDSVTQSMYQPWKLLLGPLQAW